MHDRALDTAHLNFAIDAQKVLSPEQVYTDYLHRFAYGTDASLYRYVPEVVVRAHNEEEVVKLMKIATEHNVALTFRAAGTSLSGQTSSESVLVLMGDGFHNLEVGEKGESITLGPMVIGADANRALKPYGRKIGPDPASINAARIGGIVANNSSGMCCGTKDNSYHTLQDIRLVLFDGTILDTRDAQSVADFRKSHADLLASLLDLRAQLILNPALKERIETKYRLKNTTGYGVNALIDFEDPVEILTHLLVGSEGTLGFVSEVVYRTVPEYEHKASAFIYFNSLAECCEAVKALRKGAPVEAVELLDGKSVHFVGAEIENLPSFFYRELKVDSAALLIETMAENSAALEQNIAQIEHVLAPFKIEESTGFQKERAITQRYWDVRKGLLPIISKGRKNGANIITEDVVFPMEHLVEGVEALTKLFEKHHYPEGMIMGHALEGNLHFVLAPEMDSAEKLQQFDAFMQELTDLVAVRFEGSLKGEHGTGRNVAPFVRKEWGDEIYAIMQQIKALFDPHKILNPDVVISDNAELHIQSVKPMPVTDDLINACMECGFCEPACPSDGLSLTPRQRISLYRNMQTLPKSGEGGRLLKKLEKGYQFAGIESCVETGMCALRCPVGINTGEFIKSLRPLNRSRLLKLAGTQFAMAEKRVRTGLDLIEKIGTERVSKMTQSAHKLFKGIPVVPEALPKRADSLPQLMDPPKIENSVVYFTTCVNRNLQEVGARKAPNSNTFDHTISLFLKAGLHPYFPDNIEGLCCGQPFISAKAPVEAAKVVKNLNEALLKASQYGEIPIYIDNSPCALQIHQAQREGLLDERLIIHHSAQFLLHEVVPRLDITPKFERLALHTPCSITKEGMASELAELATFCAKEVTPTEIDCCGFGGVKGFTTPEINQNSLRQLGEKIEGHCEIGASMSKSCQIGLTTHTGVEFKSIEALLDECSI